MRRFGLGSVFTVVELIFGNETVLIFEESSADEHRVGVESEREFFNSRDVFDDLSECELLYFAVKEFMVGGKALFAVFAFEVEEKLVAFGDLLFETPERNEFERFSVPRFARFSVVAEHLDFSVIEFDSGFVCGFRHLFFGDDAFVGLRTTCKSDENDE